MQPYPVTDDRALVYTKGNIDTEDGSNQSAGMKKTTTSGKASTMTEFGNTLCGTPIQFQGNGKQKNATLGGIVKLIYEDGSWDLKGLTLGHSAYECLKYESLFELTTSDEKKDSGEPLFEPTVSDEEEDGDDSDDDSASSNSDLDLASAPAHIIVNDSEYYRDNRWEFRGPLVLGEAVMANWIHAPVEDTPFFNWALIPLSRFKMNQLGNDLISDIRQALPDDRSMEPVRLMSTSGGIKSGELLLHDGYVCGDPGILGVHQYYIASPSDEEAPPSVGDGGSWVISKERKDLIGHITTKESDEFGIVLVADIFDDIIRNGLAFAVALPTEQDIESYNKAKLQDAISTGGEKEQQDASGKGKRASRSRLTANVGSTSAMAHGKEALDHDSDDSVTSTRIEVGGHGARQFLITSESRRFHKVMKNIAKIGMHCTGRHVMHTAHLSGRMCQYYFGFIDDKTAIDGLKELRKLDSDLRQGRFVEQKRPLEMEDAYPWSELGPLPDPFSPKVTASREIRGGRERDDQLLKHLMKDMEAPNEGSGTSGVHMKDMEAPDEGSGTSSERITMSQYFRMLNKLVASRKQDLRQAEVGCEFHLCGEGEVMEWE
ncbi:hypothetical protein ISF_04242 [Cordyceps fumosorosea ARSEF 2679]|uniref:Uncharacterized protein n=1 Tax=Cordyceps fumosorosea (strain ARSEF 2679) TaxID=1081104 RepID=A0A162J7F2_CORFA|nr:hypothetical protein ISF_04242 [Cordyceps fumosorosea ARSEF 2679]OAA64832.1 hypothetical protein ISF_04242 [Cordyceps fumosorosea ARSEF 2679]